jgi:hypothetical protein
MMTKQNPRVVIYFLMLILVRWMRGGEGCLQDSGYMALANNPTSAFLSQDLRHPHGKTLNNNMGIERLHNITRHETVVNTLILVLVQLGQLVLPNVHHDGVRGSRVRDRARKFS